MTNSRIERLLSVSLNEVEPLNEFERAYTTKEVSGTLGIGESSLRKWSKALETNGYPFTKNDHGYRLYLERDIVVLRQFKKLIKEANMPMENAANLIIERIEDNPLTISAGAVLSTTSVDSGRSQDVLEEQIKNVLQKLEKQEEFNKKLAEMVHKQQETIEKQNKYITEKLEDRDRKLMESMRVTMETKQLLLEAKEEKKKRKGIFSFFSKN